MFKRARTPEELATKCTDALDKLRRDRANEEQLERVRKYLTEMRTILLSPDVSTQSRALVKAASKVSLATQLVEHLRNLPFETRKDAATVFNCLIRTEVDGQEVVVEELSDSPELLEVIATGYEVTDAALTYGAILRDLCRNQTLVRKILYAESFWKLFEYMQLQTFEIASDAMATFREALTRHKDIAAEFLMANYDRFFKEYTELLEKGNYVTRRQSLKLLGELLLDSANVQVMLKYVAEVENMCFMMNLLRDESKSIQFEAFHIFKVFVANPEKPAMVSTILTKNKAKLITYLQDFQTTREDESFHSERTMLLELLADLPDAE
ncbi:Armadillo-type fold [Ostreococcus tauri]|uniref:Armadillo-type fold n=1 Tax=Ostreococcus tauri TaxID=70448 RepID=Q01CQ5_OSTTA|nr:Armadillo-type fold [Ostreococcus tauri]OUS43851.1 CGI-66 protein [Ostreococcus tauri]CAL52898.1 Armadillo-type fold [Ostreococcus tauri]|eukprot:XP_003078158.1 Armadillo-type fold [Ostreococcus tauri]